MNQLPCSVCSEAGHKAQKCPTLSSPLQTGFYAPAGGYRGGGDEEDDALRLGKLNATPRAQPPHTNVFHTLSWRSCYLHQPGC
jgi:hypothetical protein